MTDSLTGKRNKQHRPYRETLQYGRICFLFQQEKSYDDDDSPPNL